MYRYNQIRDIHLEVTSKCQARCPMCPRRINGGPLQPFMTLDEIDLETFINWFPKDFVRQLSNLNMCGNLGDPMIAKDTLEIFKYLRDTNPLMHLQMHTNGSGRNKEWWQNLASLNVTVVFGIDGLADTHSRYRINTDWNKIIENAKSFISAKGIARWDMLVFDHNKHQTEDCHKLAMQLGFEGFEKKNSSRFKDGKFHVLNDEGQTIDILYPTEKSKSFTEQVKQAKQEQIPTINCKAKQYSQLYVSANGNVSPCCWLDLDWVPPISDSRIDYMDKIKQFPNLHKQSLVEIFESDYFNKIESTWNTGSCLKECKKQCGSFDKLRMQFESHT